MPQQAWIVNASIRENIVFGQEFSSRRYENVLDACALRPDLQMMPNGDRTEIGDRVSNVQHCSCSEAIRDHRPSPSVSNNSYRKTFSYYFT